MFSLITILFSFISLFGWFFCLGHLVVLRLRPSWNKFTLIFGISFALTEIFLGLITPWMPLPSHISFVLGLLCSMVWFFKKPLLPAINYFDFKTIFFPISIFLLSIYFFVIVLLPNNGYDNLSYHIPFIREFSTFGQIPFPDNPINWVDHVHFVYPKSIEMVFGFANQFFPDIYPFIHFLLVAGIVFLLPDLSKKVGVKKIWAASALFLSSSFVLGTVKHYFVETCILFLYLAILLLLSERKDTSGRIGLLFILGTAIAMSKISAIIILFGTGIAAYYFYRSRTEFFSLVSGGFIGTIIVFLPSLFLVSLFREFNIVQVTSQGQVTPIELRIYLILEGFKRFILSNIWGVSFALSPFAFMLCQKSRPIFGMIFFSLLAFCGVFVLTNVYSLTYLQVGAYYSFAFIGALSISLPIFLEKIDATFLQSSDKLSIVVIIFILIFGGAGVLSYTKSYVSGNVLDGIFYEDLSKHVPNTSGTTLFFMNNVNPLTVGFEKIKIMDHTTFPRPTGDPCTFWKENKITHVVYWRVSSTSYQLDGGNPAFYLAAQDALLSKTCVRLLMKPPTSVHPLIAEVIYEN